MYTTDKQEIKLSKLIVKIQSLEKMMHDYKYITRFISKSSRLKNIIKS